MNILNFVMALSPIVVVLVGILAFHQVGNESQVMRRTLPAFAVILVIYMALTMLYTCVLFPNFGM